MVESHHDETVERWLQLRLAEIGDKRELLDFALKHGRGRLVAELLGLDVQKKSDWDLLKSAITEGNSIVVGQLLAHRPDLGEMKGDQGKGILHLAASSGHVNVIEQVLTSRPELINATDSDRKTALHDACLHTLPEAVACLLAHAPAIHEDVLWASLDFERPRTSEVVNLLCAHNPEFIKKVTGKTVLHRVFGFQDPWDPWEKNLFSEELMTAMWQLSPPLVLHATAPTDLAFHSVTPFEVAILSNNKFAIELVQGKLSLEEIFEAYAQCEEKCPLPAILDQFGEAWLVSLNKDVVNIVYKYLEFEERPNKSRKV